MMMYCRRQAIDVTPRVRPLAPCALPLWSGLLMIVLCSCGKAPESGTQLIVAGGQSVNFGQTGGMGDSGGTSVDLDTGEGPVSTDMDGSAPGADGGAAGTDVVAKDVLSKDVLSKDTTVPDTAGNDAAGDDTAGKDTAGKDTAGKDTAGCAAKCAPNEACVKGTCKAQCEVGLVACGAACVVVDTDPAHCGGCNKPCPAGAQTVPQCKAGKCVTACTPGFADCDGLPQTGCETDVTTDALHCGTCGKVCPPAPDAVASCKVETCMFTCNPGKLDCNGLPGDGCEADVQADAKACGGCGKVCAVNHVAAAGCAAGLCAPTCEPDFGDCNGPQAADNDDGCEQSLKADLKNCGACGKVCAAGEKCCGGTCSNTSDCGLTITKVDPPTGWQNGGDYVTITGTGFGAGVKVFLADGVAPAWAKDAQTLIIQTPPNPAVTVDLKVVQGANTALLAGGFTYVSGGINLPWFQKKMSVIRGEAPGIGVMQNGKVLVAGGTTKPDSTAHCLNTAEVYDRASDTVSTAANTMSTKRWHSSVVTLLSGKALVVGGCVGCAGGNDNAAELFDPKTNKFSAAAPMNAPRNYTRSVLLPDGKVFVASRVGPVEIYDPVANSWKLVPHATPHKYGFVVRLRDGRVMLGGGDGGEKSVYIFDGAKFTATASLHTARSMLSAHTLPDGRVVVIGGSNVSAGSVKSPQSSYEFWSPKTGQWTYGASKLAIPRTWHASALLRDGRILVMGGYSIAGSCAPTASVEQLDPVKDKVTNFGPLPNPNTEWTAVTLLDGSVLGVGGGACGGVALPDIDFLYAF